MTRKSLAATFVLALFVAPAFADVPDGHGGRTSPQALNRPRPVVAAPHACCASDVPPATGRIVRSPAELKAFGHLAGVARNEPTAAAVPCYKRVAYRPAVLASPVEAKVFGHLAARTADNGPRLGRNCCETGRCPMRHNVTASR